MQYSCNKISFCVKLISSHKKISMKLFQIITTTFFVLFSHFLTGQNFVEAFDHIALCYRNKNDLENAEFYYKKSLQIEPKGLTAVQNLAVVYSHQNKPQQALEQYKHLMMADMSNPEAYYGIAHLLLENNSNLPKALEYTDIALNIYRVTNDFNYSDGLFMKGLIYYLSNDTKNAKKYLIEAKSKGAIIPAEIAQKLKIK